MKIPDFLWKNTGLLALHFCPFPTRVTAAPLYCQWTITAGADIIDQRTRHFHEIKITGSPRTRCKRAPRFLFDYHSWDILRSMDVAQKSAANCLHNDLKRTYIGKKRRGAKERCAFFIGAAACREYVEFYLYSNFTPACKIFFFY